MRQLDCCDVACPCASLIAVTSHVLVADVTRSTWNAAAYLWPLLSSILHCRPFYSCLFQTVVDYLNLMKKCVNVRAYTAVAGKWRGHVSKLALTLKNRKGYIFLCGPLLLAFYKWCNFIYLKVNCYCSQPPHRVFWPALDVPSPKSLETLLSTAQPKSSYAIDTQVCIVN